MTLYGGMVTDDREKIKAAFQANPTDSPVRILLATDAASEGIDLQNHCHRLIHIEIPWNPNRMEQRNGRIDRHGQTKDVLICHFVSKGYKAKSDQPIPAAALDADLEFLMRAVNKVEQIREDLGKVGPVIAQQVEEAMLGRRTQLQTEMAEQGVEPVRKLLKFET
jgi:superfamily II DNA/RNA helicase